MLQIVELGWSSDGPGLAEYVIIVELSAICSCVNPDCRLLCSAARVGLINVANRALNKFKSFSSPVARASIRTRLFGALPAVVVCRDDCVVSGIVVAVVVRLVVVVGVLPRNPVENILVVDDGVARIFVVTLGAVVIFAPELPYICIYTLNGI